MFWKCKKCGMLLTSKREYHPYVACELYLRTSQAEKVEDWLRGIIQYGMAAEKQGVSLDAAMRDTTKVNTR